MANFYGKWILFRITKQFASAAKRCDSFHLRSRLGGHLKERGVSFEDTIEIEYVERFPSPEPQDCLLHDDWVSAVHTRNNWYICLLELFVDRTIHFFYRRILTGCYDHSINIWTIKGKHTLTVPGHLAPVKAVSWISMNDTTATFVSVSQDQTAMIWEWNIEQNAIQCMYVCKGHERGVDSVDVSPSGKLFATGSWDTLLKVWSAGKCLHTIMLRCDEFNLLFFRSSGCGR